jgi:hypothetical protein
MRNIPEKVKDREPEAKLFYNVEKIICSCGWFINVIQRDTVINKAVLVECTNMNCSQFEKEKKIPMPEIFWE